MSSFIKFNRFWTDNESGARIEDVLFDVKVHSGVSPMMSHMLLIQLCIWLDGLHEAIPNFVNKHLWCEFVYYVLDNIMEDKSAFCLHILLRTTRAVV